MSRWKAGDVAMVRPFVGDSLKAIRAHDGSPGWYSGRGFLSDSDVDDAYSALFVDPEDPETQDRLAEALRVGPLDVGATLARLLKPPKPEEPTGLGAVVEDTDGTLWIRAARIARGWHKPMGTWSAYAGIAAVRVLSPGVQP